MLLVDSRTAAEKLATMPADADMGLLYRTYSASSKREDGSSEWDDRPVWGLHHGDPYPFWLDWHPGAGVPSGTSDVFPDHVPALCRMVPLLAILPNGLPS